MMSYLCSKDIHCDDKNLWARETCDTITRDCSNMLLFTKHRTVGRLTVLALRIIALDAQRNRSTDELSRTIFRDNRTSFSMKSQFRSCSYNDFKRCFL